MQLPSNYVSILVIQSTIYEVSAHPNKDFLIFYEIL